MAQESGTVHGRTRVIHAGPAVRSRGRREDLGSRGEWFRPWATKPDKGRHLALGNTGFIFRRKMLFFQDQFLEDSL